MDVALAGVAAMGVVALIAVDSAAEIVPFTKAADFTVEAVASMVVVADSMAAVVASTEAADFTVEAGAFMAVAATAAGTGNIPGFCC